MTGIFLLIPDIALCEAVSEQLSLAKVGEIDLLDVSRPWLDVVAKAKTAVVIVDKSGADKLLMSDLGTLAKMTLAPTLLMLGASEETVQELESVSETFPKPFRLGHLVARVKYYLETAPRLRDRPIEFGSYRLEPYNRCIVSTKSSETIRLTEKETSLLTFLARSEKPVTRRDILAEVWGYDERIDTHTLETHIYQLRRKFDGSKDFGEENWLLFEAGAYRLSWQVAG